MKIIMTSTDTTSIISLIDIFINMMMKNLNDIAIMTTNIIMMTYSMRMIMLTDYDVENDYNNNNNNNYYCFSLLCYGTCYYFNFLR